MTDGKHGSVTSGGMEGPLEGLPLPDPGLVTDFERGFWEGARDGELRLQQCSRCERFRHLPTPMCPHCYSLDYQWTRVSGRGNVYSYVIANRPMHRALADPEQCPYNICLIELEEQEGLRVVSNVLDIAPEDLYVGMPVEVTFRATRTDPDIVLPLFVPV